ncbi:MAG: bifunctional metallophosphatase/5'-nucleotidase [Fimbriimonadaceae bacterium]|nr:bifunctional metallophosphatase/5'-nucleotidase [Fimbriimonadaceae bacterium]
MPPRRHLHRALLAALLAVGLGQPLAAETLQLGIMHTNDHHGHVLPFRESGQNNWGGVARRRVAIQRERADTSYQWLLLDAGDVFQGTPISNLLSGFLDLECMNQMGYDAMALGNHEFDFGYEVLRSRMADVHFKLLCANIIDKERGLAVAQPYAIFRRGAYRIGVIGVTTETLPGETHPKVQDHVLAYPGPIVKGLAQYLRGAGCDLVVALTHQGYQRDLAMAREIPELDVIVGGHTHTKLDQPTRVGDVLVTQTNGWGRYLGVLKMVFERPAPGQRFKLASYANKYQPMSPELPEDDGLKAFINEYDQRLRQEMSKVVATATMDFHVEQVRLRENALANLVADALRGQTDSDIGLFNGGNFRAPLAAGEVTAGDLYSVLPFDNFLVRVTLSGARVREMLEYSAQQYGDGGFLQVSGLRVKYRDGALAEVKVGTTEATAVPLDPAKSYRVVMTDFLAIGGDGFPLKEDPYGPGYTGLEQRAAFSQWAAAQRTLTGQVDGRLQVEWVGKPDPGLKD